MARSLQSLNGKHGDKMKNHDDLKHWNLVLYITLMGLLIGCSNQMQALSSFPETSDTRAVNTLTTEKIDCTLQPCRYVREGANGNGSDWNNAYSSLPENLVRGTTYFIANGTYSGQTFDTPEDGTELITIQKASVADHGSDIGWSDSYGDGQATFTSTLEFTTSYWTIDGVTGGGAENNWNQNFGFKIIEHRDDHALIRIAYTGKADYITIRHIDMEGKGSVSQNGGSYSNDGVAIYGANNITLSYFHMKGIGRCPFFISPQDNIFEHGWVESFFGSPSVHSEIASIFSYSRNVGDVTFRYNLFTDIQSTGGLMWDNSSNPSAHMYVYGNIFYKPDGAVWGKANGLIGGWTGGHGEEFHNVWVYNNTFINIDQQSLSTFPNVYSDNRAYNNLFYNCQSPQFEKFADHDYNLFINSGDTQSEANGISLKGKDPFVNFIGLDFRLKAATTAGKILPSPFQVDILNMIRGADGILDRGAFEFGSNL